MNKFETFWNDLSIQLKTNKKIKNWTIKKGNFGEDFTAQIKNNNSIMITTLKGSEQSVSRKDFQLIYDDWDGYVNERIKRIEFSQSRFTKYTISIIHQFLK
jgi:hypothetical protein